MITIAVIDDDRTLLDLMAELFAERGWGILPLQDVSNALQCATSDAILLDVRLGRGQMGWSVLEELLTDSRTRDVPVIVWSGDARLLEEKREWLQERRIPVISKPFNIDDVLECLDRVLGDMQPHAPAELSVGA